MTDRKLPLPKIFPGDIRPHFAPTQAMPIEEQPIRRIPGGMRVITDPLDGSIRRDPRDPGRGTRPALSPAQRVQELLGPEVVDFLRQLVGTHR